MSDLSNGFTNTNDEKDLAPRIHKLISQYPEDEVDSRVIKFFEAFDQTQLQKIEKKNEELQSLKA